MDDNRIICNCFHVTQKDIRNAIEDGARTFEKIQEITHLSLGCGSCTMRAEKTISLFLEEDKKDDL